MELTDALKYAALVGSMLGGFVVSSLFLWRVLLDRLGAGSTLVPRVDAWHADLKTDIKKLRGEVEVKFENLLRRCDRIESRLDGLYDSRN
jgi:hypothetical protein